MIKFSEICNQNRKTWTHRGTTKNVTHSYGDVYDKLFVLNRDSCERILEIGADSGFALDCYTKFFTNATVYGIDLNDRIPETIKSNPRIQFTHGDAFNKDVLQKLPMQFDFIIEDASHLLQDQI